MKFSISQVSIVVLILCFCTQTQAEELSECNSSAAAGTLCQMKVKDLHPTQFAVGSVAVECKKRPSKKNTKRTS